ncbi:MAG: hypothetical protein ACI915_002995 [Gammaproteobacteria bacterium]
MANPALILPVEAIANRLNTDPEFKLTSRYWYGDIRFVIGEEKYFMRIENGKVGSFVHGTNGFDPYTIDIVGTEEVWEHMFEAVPKPFYHDWFAASFHHDFEFGGDLESAYAYYYSIRRIKLIMGEEVRAAQAARAA